MPSLDFNRLSGRQKWNLKAHMWYQLSVALAPMCRRCSTTSGNIHLITVAKIRATPLLACYDLIQSHNVIDLRNPKDDGVRKALSIRSPFLGPSAVPKMQTVLTRKINSFQRPTRATNRKLHLRLVKQASI